MNKLTALALPFVILGAYLGFGTAQEPERPSSPSLVALLERLKAGDKASLEAFWHDTTRKGAPLIEQIDGDSRHVLVTFLWRAKGETNNVLLFSYALTAAGHITINAT